MSLPISREEAMELLKEHTKEEANFNHYLETEAILRELAKHVGEDEEVWGLVGLLHDLDWEETANDTNKHTIVTCEILKEKGFPEDILYAIKSHNNEYLDEDYSPKSPLDYALRCGETITGLIYAGVLVRPDKKVENVPVKSIRKKFKDKRFAANCRRELIMECEHLGLSLDEFIEISLRAFRGIADEVGL